MPHWHCHQHPAHRTGKTLVPVAVFQLHRHRLSARPMLHAARRLAAPLMRPAPLRRAAALPVRWHPPSVLPFRHSHSRRAWLAPQRAHSSLASSGEADLLSMIRSAGTEGAVELEDVVRSQRLTGWLSACHSHRASAHRAAHPVLTACASTPAAGGDRRALRLHASCVYQRSARERRG